MLLFTHSVKCHYLYVSFRGLRKAEHPIPKYLRGTYCNCLRKGDGGWVSAWVKGMLVQILSLVINYMQVQNKYLNKW